MSDKPIDLDPVVEEIIRLMKPFAERIATEEERALLVLGVRYYSDSDGVETGLVSTGYLGIIAEGLYAELTSQLEQGNGELFFTLRQVIHDIEAELGISDPEESNGSSALH